MSSKSLIVAPVNVHSPHLEMATVKSREAIKQRMVALCRDIGTTIADRGDSLEIPLDR